MYVISQVTANPPCNANSPATEDIQSPTVPPIAITHIFCGQIKGGKAEGFHFLPPKKLENMYGKVSEKNTNPALQCYKTVEVFNSATTKWIARDNVDSFCFYPSVWTYEKTLQFIGDQYHRCVTDRILDGFINKKQTSFTVCSLSVIPSEFEKPGAGDLISFVTITNPKMKQTRIVSSFPDWHSDKRSGCDVVCK